MKNGQKAQARIGVKRISEGGKLSKSKSHKQGVNQTRIKIKKQCHKLKQVSVEEREDIQVWKDDNKHICQRLLADHNTYFLLFLGT